MAMGKRRQRPKQTSMRFYAGEVGRPGSPPGRYLRLLLIGYFEGLGAERAMTR